jgi:Uma2 family endonuclease
MATVSFNAASPNQVELPLRRFTAAEYMSMVDARVFAGQRVELIGGCIVEMSPANADHNYLIMQLTELLSPLLGSFKILVQGTLSLDDGHVFDPDLLLLKIRDQSYRDGLPTAADVALVIEVAGTSLARDAEVKLPVYAKLGIPEYWVVDLSRETFIVHRQPSGNQFAEVKSYAGQDSVSPLAAPELLLTIDAVFAR